MQHQNRVILVGVHTDEESRDHFEETMQELEQLAQTAGVFVAHRVVQHLPCPHAGSYVGKGKLREIANLAKSKDARTLVFNNNLSPSQSRGISDSTHCNVVDRTELILDIFAQHARTKQAKLQVELAQLEYTYTKLKNLWKHLSRIQGGIGFRGPGEKQIEVDRRLIRRRIGILKQKLQTVDTVGMTKRKRRSSFTSVALVGYTNAGKSTLFNRLTKEDRYTADQLFATLDAKTRKLHGPFSSEVMLTDTIGFIRKLPHKLVSSFHSTLHEVVEADLLLHVVDVSHDTLFELVESVDTVLHEIRAHDKDILMVFNKVDRMSGTHFLFLKKKIAQKYPDHVFISAKSGQGLDELRGKIAEFIKHTRKARKIRVPMELSNLQQFIRRSGEVLEEDFDASTNEAILTVKIPRQLFPTIEKQISDFKLKMYIHK